MKKKSASVETTQEDAKPAKISKRSGKSMIGSSAKTSSGMTRYLSGAVVISALVIVAGSLAMGWLQFGRHQEMSEQLLARTLADQYTALLGNVVRNAEAAVSGIAANPAVDRTFAEENPVAASTLSAALPGASVTLLPPDQVLPPDSLSFTARDVLKQARGADAPVSAMVPGTPPVLYVSRGSAAGTMVVLEQPLSDLGALIAKMTPENVYVVLKQPGGQPLFTSGQVVSEGQQASQKAAGGVEVQVIVPKGAQDPGLLTLFLLIGIGMLLIVTLVILSAFFAATSALRKDAALLTHFAGDLADHGQASPRGKLSFPPLEAVISSLRKLAELGGAPGAPASARRSAGREDEFRLSAADSKLLTDAAAPTMIAPATAVTTGTQLPESIFREYDIRGIVGETLTADSVELLGRAIGTEALQAGQQTVIVGRDGRLHSPELAEALIRGLTLSGRDVIDIGPARRDRGGSFSAP